MIITFDDIIKKRDWLHSCLMASLTDEAMDSGIEKQQYDVKLLVNGIELEPVHLGTLLDNVETYIKEEAKKMADDQLQIAQQKAFKLQNIVDEACEKIREEFGIDNQNDEVEYN